jgi:serine/threonine protein kinase
MSLSFEQFTAAAVECGALQADELQAALRALPDEKRRDVQSLARALVAAGKLTKYQAQQIYTGKGKDLVFGQYVLLDKLGQGGMGQVFKARHRVMQRLVALKVLSAEAMKSPEAVQRFRREVKAAARLNHPNIVTALDADQAGGIHYLVMECVEADLTAKLWRSALGLVRQRCASATRTQARN